MAKATINNVRPIGDRIIVKDDAHEAEQKTDGGIIKVETGKERMVTATVIAVGPGADRQMATKVGDRVMYRFGTGFHIEIGGENYRTMREGELVVIL